MATAPPAPHPTRPGDSGSRRAAEPHRIRFGILARTTVTMLAVGVLPLAVFGGLGLLQEWRRVRGEAERSLEASSERVAMQVDEWVDKNVRVLRASASLPALVSMRGEDQAPVLAAIQRAYPWMYLVHTIAPGGRNVARSDGNPLGDYADRQYFKEVMAGKPLRGETVIGKTSGKPALILAVPIVASGATVGVLSVAMTIEDVSAMIAAWRTGRTGFAFLVDEQAKVVAHPRGEYVTGQVRLTDHPLVSAFRQAGQPGTAAFTQTDATEALGSVRGTRFGWTVVVQQNEEELFAPLRQSLVLGAGLLAASALLVALLARRASARLVRPILEMSRAADRMSSGDLEHPISAGRHDELGVLARSLERLRISLRAAMARLR
jgi:methyl-accepting chemotaxis protein